MLQGIADATKQNKTDMVHEEPKEPVAETLDLACGPHRLNKTQI